MTSPASPNTSTKLPFENPMTWQNTLSEISNENKLMIFSYFDIPALTNASGVSRDFYPLANDPLLWKNIAENIGFKNLENKEDIILKITTINTLKKAFFPEITTKSITIASIKETIQKINEIKIRDTIKIWEKIYEQAEQITGKPTIDIPKFDELKKSKDKKYIKQVFANWIKNNKDNFNLIKLNLGYLELDYLPKEICDLSQLQNLLLFCNKLTYIPKEIGNLSELITLDLHNNKLISVPQELGKLSQLVILYLQENNLASIPEELGKLSQLLNLHLKNNKLTNIPEKIGKLTSLIELDLRCNLFNHYPKCLDQLIDTKIFIENHLRIKKILANIFSYIYIK